MEYGKRLLNDWVNWWALRRRKRRGCRQTTIGCLGLMLLLLLLGCGLLVWWVSALDVARADEDDALSVLLLVDNSESMFSLNGVGSDPGLLRVDAARLFISYLGIDDGTAVHECGVLFFGTTAELVAPLTPLDSDARRQTLYSQIAQPPRMGWTDQAEALRLALAEAQTAANQPVLVMLTDGKGEPQEGLTAVGREAYIEEVRQLGEELTAQKIPVFIILLANEATDADPEIAGRWRPLWQTLAAATGGSFFEARQPEELVGIYHDVVVQLTANQTETIIRSAEVAAAGLRETVSVEPDLVRLTLVISKSDPSLTVTVLSPDGTPLRPSTPNVRFAGSPAEAVWAIDNPPAGEWTIQANGAGHVTVWKDYQPAPASATPLPPPTITASPPATTTPTPLPAATAIAAPPTAVSASPTTIATGGWRGAASAEPAPSAGPTTPLSWFWLLLLGLFLALGVRYQRHRRQRPFVDGVLRLLSGPGFSNSEQVIELDTWRRPRLTIGTAPADLPLADFVGKFTLTTGKAVDGVGGMDGEVQILLGKSAVGDGPEPKGVLVNGRSLTASHPLQDMDVITAGPTTLRYENLRLRPVVRRPVKTGLVKPRNALR